MDAAHKAPPLGQPPQAPDELVLAQRVVEALGEDEFAERLVLGPALEAWFR